MTDFSSDLTPPLPRHRLQWRLVRSYMVVSAITTSVIGIGSALWMAYYFFWSPKITHDFEVKLPKAVRASERYFGPQPGQVDRAGLQRWLDYVMPLLSSEVYLRTTPRLHVQLLDLIIEGGQIVISDRQSNLLASSPDGQLRSNLTLNPRPEGIFHRDRPLTKQVTPREQAVFDAAWQGRCLAQIINSRLICVTPVMRDGKVRAVCCFRSPPVFNLRDEVVALSTSVLPVVATVIVLSTVIGGVVGHLTAARLTRQLGTIAHVAASWAQGSFIAAAPETPEDELGLLGKHLNRMVADLQVLLGLRRTLAVVEERNRIARDLHDTVKQHIFAAGLQVGAAQTRLEAGDVKGAAQNLGELEALIALTRTELVVILQELRFIVPGDTGQLVETLRQTAITWGRQAGIPVRFEQDGITYVPAGVATELHRILQEALANVARHSHAKSVQVSLWQDAGTLILEVDDDGVGFDIAPISEPIAEGRGMGLQTMRERTRLLPEGAFEISSSSGGGGTRLMVRCDVQEKAV